MPRLFLSALLVAGLASAASAQQLVPAPKKEFLDSAFVVLPSEAGARYYRETVYSDSIAGTVKDYYLSGKLQSSGTFDHVRKFSAHGTLETWFESGQLESRSTYVHDEPQELLYYYPTGQLKRHERYAGKKRTLAQCFAADGKKIRFFEYRQRPVYPEGDGGERAVVLAVMHNVVYPPEALRDNITGKVLLRFVVSPAGEASRVEVTQSAHPMLDAAAMLAVQNLKRFKPGLQDGKPVNVYYTVPVSFSIK
ncbi:MAG TPA: TonB family protein [Hymenobacter sp.]|uniref:TonB family protein n=1 Tax=Hymenobacter sp. TaxID=1898978 RepID=UPI002D7FA3E3|nr:TonB family protein [Hymenobacter sp.]HET9504291.1 TonB family protein [Hymenobacter sp.]